MKKHLKEERHVFIPRISSLFLLFLLNLSFLNAQIPLNGFCTFNSFKVDKDYDGIICLNSTNDTINNFLLFSSKQSKHSLIHIDINNRTQKNDFVQLPFASSRIISTENNFRKEIVSVSRNARKLSILSFNQKSNLNLSKQIKFNSYPDKISTGDIDFDEENEFLISGSSFDGLSIVKRSNSLLVEEKILKKSSFSQSVLFDINNDSYCDIIAYNVLTGTLQFYFNNGRGDFNLTRDIPVPPQIGNLAIVDINNDAFPDLVFSSGRVIYIHYGDGTSAYNNNKSLSLDFIPDKILWNDFNNDGKTDFVYLNKERSVVNLVLQKNQMEFFPEICSLQKKGLEDLVIFQNHFTKGIAMYCKDGNLITLTQQWDADEIKITFGGILGLIETFDYLNDGIQDICYIDERNTTLNLVIRNKQKKYEKIFFIPVYTNYSQVEILEKDKFEKEFYLYDYNKRVIEIVIVNLNKFSYQKEIIYTDGLIKDLKLTEHQNFSRGIINTLQLINGQLYSYSYSYNNLRYMTTSSSAFDRDVIDALFDDDGNIYYWKQENSNLLLRYISHSDKQNKIDLYSVKAKENSKITLLSCGLINQVAPVSFSILTVGDKTNGIIAGKNYKLYLSGEEIDKFFSFEKKDIYVPKKISKSDKKLSLYLLNKNIITFVKSNFTNSRLIFENISEQKNVNFFVVKKFLDNELTLLFTNNFDNCIEIKKLK